MTDENTNMPTLIVGIGDKPYKVSLKTDVNDYNFSEKEEATWKKIKDIGEKAVFDMADTGCLKELIRDYSKGKVRFLFEVEFN